MKKQFTVVALFFISFQISFAQNQFWKKTNGASAANSQARIAAPKAYAGFELNTIALQQFLKNAPEEFSAAAQKQDFLLALPTPEGDFETFAISHSPIMAPELMVKFPEIRTYAGVSVGKNHKTVRFTLSPKGLQAAVYKSDLGIDYIEPFEQNGLSYYQVYDRKNAPKEEHSELSCLTKDEDIKQQINLNAAFTPYVPSESRELKTPVQLNTYRFACAATGTYTQDHGGTVASGLAAVVNHTNILNGILERDVQVRMILVANNDKLIFTDPVTDPYQGTDVGELMAQNPDVVNARLGMSTYDLGHVLSRYQGGSAIGIAGGSICSPAKARGCSAGTGAYGDGFMGTFSHEVGHQFGAGHTWNRCGGGSGRAGSSAWEPGSGNTIMSYYGACGSDNVGGGDLLNYHSGTVEEMLSTQTAGWALGCAEPLATTNNHPEVELPYTDGFFIPIRTPFELKASATDPDGDDMTFSWEQIDLGIELPLGSVVGNEPLFRVYAPSTATNRFFPRLQTVIANQTDIAELYAEFSRDMTFRFIARDNQENGGGVTYKDVAFEATGDAGPFLVQSPNASSEKWVIGSLANVQWDVANTDVFPVNCKNVHIRLSLDGGQTYPVLLAENVANDGGYYVNVPNNVTNTARVKVEAADNIFYDISNANFSIGEATAPSLSMGLTNDNANICLPNVLKTSLQTAAVGGYDSLVTLQVLGGFPQGANVSFDKTTLNPGETAVLTIDMNGSTEEGVFIGQVEATSGGQTFIREIKLTLVSNNYTDMVLVGPSDGATSVTQSPSLTWNPVPDADSYEIQVASSPSFESGTIIAARMGLTTANYNIPVLLEKGKSYYWRVRGQNECGISAWADVSAFSTLYDVCTDFQANDLPINIIAGAVGEVSSKVNVFSQGTIQDVNVKRLDGSHQDFGDIRIFLTSPSGKSVNLYDHNCGGLSISFDFSLDDQAPTPFSCPPPNNGDPRRPVSPLAAFNGEQMAGVWTLTVLDSIFGSGGRIDAFEIELCGESSQKPPVIVINEGLSLTPGTNKLITNAELKAEDEDNGPQDLIFTLVTVPHLGRLQINGAELLVGTQFTQAQIDAGALRYYSYGSGNQDDFRFTVIDGVGGFVGTETFIINEMMVDAEDVIVAASWSLFPNPATQTVFLRFDAPLSTDVQVDVFNTIGQKVAQHLLSQGSSMESIDLNAAPSGLYFVQVRSGAWMETRRLVVKK